MRGPGPGAAIRAGGRGIAGAIGHDSLIAADAVGSAAALALRPFPEVPEPGLWWWCHDINHSNRDSGGLHGSAFFCLAPADIRIPLFAGTEVGLEWSPVATGPRPTSQMPAPNQTAPTTGGPAGRLTTWKQIARHFDRSVRTVQRWERDHGLPVHRFPTARGESVHATVDDLDRWALSTPGIASTRGGGGHGVISPNELGPECDAAKDSSGKGATRAARTAPSLPTSRYRSVAWPASFVLLALAVLVLGRWYWGSLVSSEAQPSNFRVEGDTLFVLDGRGSTLWSRGFPFRLQDQAEYERLEREYNRPPSVFSDLDGDGQREVVFVARSVDSSGSVRCYTADGTFRWDRRPEVTAHFGQGPMGPPWTPVFVLETRLQGRRPEVWVAWAHRPEFASFVERLDIRTGKPLETYWSSGHISAIVAARIGGMDALFVGAANNEFNSASLAVFNRATMEGSAPAMNPDYGCIDCSDKKPVAFFVFPKLSLAEQVSGPEAELIVCPITVDDGGRMFVTVRQVLPEGEVIYQIDAAFKVVRADLLPSYQTQYEQLYRSGKITRPFNLQASKGELWPVRSWVGDGYVLIEGPQHR
jgi:hypothetical protein